MDEMTMYLLVIVGTFFGFIGLAYLLLAPVNRFLNRENELSKEWTKDAIARRAREEKSGTNGQNKSDDRKRSD